MFYTLHIRAQGDLIPGSTISPQMCMAVKFILKHFLNNFFDLIGKNGLNDWQKIQRIL
jgi:hypothetical protein